MNQKEKSMRFISALLLAICLGCGGSDSDNFEVIGAPSADGATGKLSSRFAQEILAGSPTSFKVTLFGAYISVSEDCSNPIQIADYGAEGQEFDLFSSPTLFSANLEEGTYNCLILQFNDVMKFTADDEAVAAHAGCVDTTTEYTFDVYREENSSDSTWVDLDGNAISATGSAASPEANRAFAFASTASDSTAVLANGLPISEHQFVTLSAPLVVPGQTTYYWDATDGITNHEESGGNYCWLEHPTTGFK